MKKISKAVSVFMCFALLLCNFVFPTFAEDNTVKSESTIDLTILEKPSNVFNKIHFYFDSSENSCIDDMQELQSATATLKEDFSSSVSSLNNNTRGADNNIEITVQFDSPYTKTPEFIEFNREREEIDSLEELRSFRSRLNAFSKEYHDALFENNVELLSDFEYNEIQHIDYSPFAIMSVDPGDLSTELLLDLASSEGVTNVSVASEGEARCESDTFDNTLDAINASDIISNEIYTGLGIKVGVLEVALPNVYHENFWNKHVIVKESTETFTEADVSHATRVASIIMEMAPDAIYHFASTKGMPIGIAWFIQQGCDVVNCSFGYYNNGSPNDDGIYSNGIKEYRYDIDGVYDYQISTSFISVVKSSGNYSNNNRSSSYNPNNQISSPGYAYNVITVGGVRNIGTNNVPVFSHDPDASFLCDSNYAKPNICGMYEVSIPGFNGTSSGTSFAAPQVTASIALLMDSDVSLIAWPETILSRLTATARKTADYSNDNQYFDEKVGAGLLDLESALENTLSLEVNHTDDDDIPGSEVARLQLNLPANVELSVAAAWKVYADNTSNSGISISDVDFTDYDLYLYAPGETIIGSGGSIVAPTIKSTFSNNIELIRHTTTVAGVYTLLLYQKSSRCYLTSDDWIIITYNY